MSLMKTLAKVAVGVAVAKGASAMMKNGQRGSTSQAGGLGGLLGGLTGGSAGGAGGLGGMLGGLTGGSAGGAGGLQDMLGGLLGGGAAGGSTGSGGLGGLLESLGGAQGGAGSQGGLGGLLGGLAGAAGAGGLLGGLGGAVAKAPAQNDQSFGAVLNSQFDQTPEAPIEPSQDQEAAAALMLSAMIQAAKSDGTFDDAEKEKLLGQLGDVDAEEAAFVQAQLSAPIDIDGLVANTPDGMGQQVYAMSVVAIDLDTQDEAQYLHKLASAFGLQPAKVNDIHAQLGVASLYT
ncbi:tellurite resistance TerB family protein [Sulfitobacter sp. S223]|uniref:tellurite resistance TerB family protein n=1 Tax=Sulfitobacter sp. S223 TaxID=2867023 RepID=UPI0021A326DF|nr:tellurite resistance TerB family protein [Sulfitobacter sp. S223]UWR27846.1 tellurite resistance TerB family protein [Sulfitobacter sp. S223]